MKRIGSFSIKSICLVGVLFVASWLFSRLGKVHGKSLPESYFSDGYPTILTLLDSEFFMGFIACVTLAIVVYVLYLLWQLHEVAVHKAKEMSSAHTQIVFALSLCGLFIDKAWWVLAIIIAFTRWDVVANSLSSIIRNGLNKINKAQE
ncbi:magnesium transporter [Vibrio sp. TRT 17S01]|uniref:magnesium transporter n=1 Tax=Vibrio sp. TRT 17S01 TaxID=3418505 RepID=UPI003CE7AE5D